MKEEQNKKELERQVLEQKFKEMGSLTLRRSSIYLPHREEVVTDLVKQVEDFLNNPEDKLRTVRINGHGCTTVLDKFSHLLRNHDKAEEIVIVGLDCKPYERIVDTALKQIIRRIKGQPCPELFEESHTFKNLIAMLIDLLVQSDKKIIMVLENFSSIYFSKSNQILQALLEVKDIEMKSGVFYIFQSYVKSGLYKKNIYEYLPDTYHITLEEYSEKELQDIIEIRMEDILTNLSLSSKLTDTISEESIKLIAYLAKEFAGYGSSYTMDLLKHSGIVAFADSNIILPDHVREANRILGYGGCNHEMYESETSYCGRIVLLGILEELEQNKSALISFEEVVEQHKQNYQQYKGKILTHDEIWECIDNMRTYRILWYKLADQEKKSARICVPCFTTKNGLKMVKRWIYSHLIHKENIPIPSLWRIEGRLGVDIYLELLAEDKVWVELDDIVSEFDQNDDENIFYLISKLLEDDYYNDIFFDLNVEIINAIGERKERRALSSLRKLLYNKHYWLDSISALLKFEDSNLINPILSRLENVFDGKFEVFESIPFDIEWIFEKILELSEEIMKAFVEKQIENLSEDEKRPTSYKILSAINNIVDQESNLGKTLDMVLTNHQEASANKKQNEES